MIFKRILIVLALLLAPSLAYGQCSGVFPANTVCGVTTSGTPHAIAYPGGFSGFANPSATVGPSAINGTATTAMRSDAAPALANTAVSAGSYGSSTLVPTYTVDAQGRLVAAANVAMAPPLSSITGFGTGVATALGINTGSAGSVVVNGGALGTPASGVATNLTGTASGLTAGHVTTNANLTGPITSSGNATSIASQTGTGTKFVVDTGPTIANLTVTGSFTFPGLITNAELANPAAIVNGVTCTLGVNCAVTATATSVTSDSTTVISGNNTANGLLQNDGGVIHDTGVNTSTPKTINVNMSHASAAPASLPFVGSGTVGGLNIAQDGLATNILQVTGPTDSTNIFPQLNLVAFGYNSNLTAPAAILNANVLGGFVGWGYDGANFKLGSVITLNTTENWSAGSNGSGVSIYGTPNGTTTTSTLLASFAPALAKITSELQLTGSATPFSPAGFGNGYINFDTLNGGLNFQASTIIHPSATSFYNYFQWNPAELQWSTNCLGCQSGASQQIVARIPNNLLNFEIGNERFIHQSGTSSITDGSQLVLSDAFADGVITGLGSVTGGSGYTNGTYTNVLLTGGSGHFAQGTVVVSGGAVASVNFTCGPPTVAASCYAGINYNVGDVLSAATGVPQGGIGPAGSGFSVPVSSISAPTVTGPSILFIQTPNSFGNFYGFGQNSAANGDNTLRLGISNNTSFPWIFVQANEVNFALSGAIKFQTDNGATKTAVCGTQLQYLSSNSKLNLTICQPVATLAIAAAGSGGTPGTYSNVAAVSNYGHSLTVNVTVNGSGVVSAATVGNSAGTGYNVGELITFASGIGGTTGVTLSVATLATTYAPVQVGAMTATNGTFSAALTYGGVTLANSVTGTGSMALSASPTFTGTLTAAALTGTGAVSFSKTSGQIVGLDSSTTAGKYVEMSNTGGQFYLGVENSAGNSVGASDTGYSTLLLSGGANDLYLGTSATGRFRLAAADYTVTMGSLYTGVAGIAPLNSSGTNSTTTAGLSVGGSFGDYSSMGYNIQFQSGGATYKYLINDYASRIYYPSGGVEIDTAPSGTAGGAITWTKSLLVANNGGLQVGTPTGGDKGLGTINAAGAYYANGTVGVSCSGSPTASFASVNGIVTQC